MSKGRFEDIDGSVIAYRNSSISSSSIAYYDCVGPDGSAIEVVYFKKSRGGGSRADVEAEACLFSALKDMVLGSQEVDGFTVCGFDTETGPRRSGKDGDVELIQLAVGNKAILIGKRALLFQSPTLKKFFLNTLFSDRHIVFSGAELATADALDMLRMGFKMHGLLDLTPVLSQEHGDSFKRKSALSFRSDGFRSIGLRAMYQEAFSVEWQKDKDITCGDWSVEDLSLQQIKYGVLDAWVSSEMGVFTMREFRKLGVYQMLFSTVTLSPSDCTSLKHFVRQNDELQKLQYEEPKSMLLDNMQVKPRRATQGTLDVFFSVYGNHCRTKSQLTIKIISPGGSPEGIRVAAEAIKVMGRKGSVSIDMFSISHLNKAVGLMGRDAEVLREIQKSPANAIVRYWRHENDSLGPYARHSMGPAQMHEISLKLVRVRVYLKPEPDKLMCQVILCFAIPFVHSFLFVIIPFRFYPSMHFFSFFLPFLFSSLVFHSF
jgi:hypothetical protein